MPPPEPALLLHVDEQRVDTEVLLDGRSQRDEAVTLSRGVSFTAEGAIPSVQSPAAMKGEAHFFCFVTQQHDINLHRVDVMCSVDVGRVKKKWG
ncbi:hypothetical protein VZT92_011330 [Zoarces viviparus]|uniref:Uncharacterized protein n=1 Tax=Zoarces viviparus TaxID=48416 RepID=A0AAW1FBK1_ZOAVI